MFSMGVDALPEGVPCPRTGKFGVCGEISGCVWCSHALGSAPLWGTQCWGVGGPSPSPCTCGMSPAPLCHWGLADGFWGLVHELWGPVRGRWVLTDGLFGVWPMVWRWGRADWLVGAPKPWVWPHCRARGTGGLWAGVPPPHSPYLQDVTGPLFPWQRRWHPNTSHTSLAVARVTRSLQGGQVWGSWWPQSRVWGGG